jgi:hypothetical protein
MTQFPLPAPWGAPEAELACTQCKALTRHFGRRVTSLADEESDRQSGELAWFCARCGHRHEPTDQPESKSSPPDDDFTELFDRH